MSDGRRRISVIVVTRTGSSGTAWLALQAEHSAHMRKSVGRSNIQHYQRTSPCCSALHNCVSSKGYGNGYGHHPTLCIRARETFFFSILINKGEMSKLAVTCAAANQWGPGLPGGSTHAWVCTSTELPGRFTMYAVGTGLLGRSTYTGGLYVKRVTGWDLTYGGWQQHITQTSAPRTWKTGVACERRAVALMDQKIAARSEPPIPCRADEMTREIVSLTSRVGDTKCTVWSTGEVMVSALYQPRKGWV
ncbi:hypothetical protein Bbelb_230180 [Branchiostoma belcheri]|nr:hypothetical protein Bbelb_230180 [Branchiostoma belcheri]